MNQNYAEHISLSATVSTLMLSIFWPGNTSKYSLLQEEMNNSGKEADYFDVEVVSGQLKSGEPGTRSPHLSHVKRAPSRLSQSPIYKRNSFGMPLMRLHSQHLHKRE